MRGARVTSSCLRRASVFIGLVVRFPREVPTSSTGMVQGIVAGMFREPDAAQSRGKGSPTSLSPGYLVLHGRK